MRRGTCGACGKLRDAHFNQFTAELGVFTRGQNETGVWNGNAQSGDDFLESVARCGVRRVEGDFRSQSRFQTREGDGVGTDATVFFQLVGVVQESQHFESRVVETEQRAHAHVVDTGFHGPVHGVQSPLEVGFASAGVQLLVGGPMVGFLETLVGADADFVNLTESFHIKRGTVDVDAANFSALVRCDGVDVAHGLRDPVGIVLGVLAVDEEQSLVSLLFQHFHFLADFFPGQCAAFQVFVAGVETTVFTLVAAFVGDVQRGEEDKAVSVDAFLDRHGSLEDFFIKLLIFVLQENSSFEGGKAFSFQPFGQDFTDQRWRGRFGFGDLLHDKCFVDEIRQIIGKGVFFFHGVLLLGQK